MSSIGPATFWTRILRLDISGSRGGKGREDGKGSFSRRRIRPSSPRSSSPSSAERSTGRRRSCRPSRVRAGSCGSMRRSPPSRAPLAGDRPVYKYRQDVLAELWKYGVRPTEHTPPVLVRTFINEIYKFELRRLRDCYVRGEFPKHDYHRQIGRASCRERG